ncbi:C4-dicarboxylate TRAP transporter large permease protein DctM [Neomoorella glycerini]|uniref:C4-dicarboxylate TRAP transporter large permease protein DctM n=1 Tax=Neomoorella glycerini TaxID=55779 RepID=A0A6I5ZUV1_9FIRM|nr:TRAP transporter large permease [Moorella glycerini]QGP93694.1 C4-dicarboxylate TRAP transporter large permease protein DctM [Moorella glycerini]
MTPIIITVALALIFIGVPVAFSLGLGSLAALLSNGHLPLTVIPQRMMVNIDSFSLMAIPFFILAGEVMSTGTMSRRLVNFATAVVGHLRGGLGIVDVVASTIFAGISGSAAADTAAIGSIMIPPMIKKGYRPGFAASLQAAAGSLGPIIPPSIVMIIYGSITGLSIASLFMGGLVPGLIMATGLALVAYLYALKNGLGAEHAFSLKRVFKASIEAGWALILPLIILGGIVFGIFTPTEAGAVAVVYAFIVGLFIYRDIKFKDVPHILLRAGLSSAVILIIVGAASVASWLLASERFSEHVVGFFTAISSNRYVVYLLLLAFVIAVGMLVETVASAILLVPVLFPVAAQLGFDPVHFGVVVSIALVFAGLTPPVAVILYITTAIAKCSFAETCRFLLPFLAVCFATLLLAAFIPQLVLWVPSLMR